MTLSSRHRIQNSSTGGLRPSTLPLSHGGSPQYWLSHVNEEETFFVSFKPPRPGTEPRTLAWKAAVLTTTLGPPPFTSCSAVTVFRPICTYVLFLKSAAFFNHWRKCNNLVSEWILLYVASSCVDIATDRQFPTQGFFIVYHSQHCTLRIFEQFWALQVFEQFRALYNPNSMTNIRPARDPTIRSILY